MTVTKSTIRELACLGGQPAFSEQLYVNRPNLGDRGSFMARMEAMFDRRWFTNDGPLVRELENKLARYLGVEHCIATCNGTVALDIVCRALGLRGEVIVPSFTFVATAHALLWQGLEPVFCDIDPETWNIDPTQCEALITDRTTAIVGVHLWGRPCDTQRLEEVAHRHGLRLVFDAAHAFGCSHLNAMIGRFGDAEVFSFHATKVFHTFEGGAVATDDNELATQLRRIRNFGFAGYDAVAALGTNAKMSEASAAMGLANLDSLDGFVEENRRNHFAYRQGLDGVPGLRLLLYPEQERSNYHYVVVEVDEDLVGLTRDQLLKILHAENVVARRYFYPGCHRLEPYATKWPGVDHRLPHTNRVARRVLVLPAGTGVTRPQIQDICAILRLAVSRADAVREALASYVEQGRGSVEPAWVVSEGSEVATPTARDAPSLELRVPISPNDKDLRMLWYLLESLQEFGGPIGRAAHCVASVGADEPPRDLAREYPWTSGHSLEFQWVDRELFRQQTYDATGFHRFQVESDADLVAMIDVDLLVAGDFDRELWRAYREQSFLGFIAHVSPFEGPLLRETPSQVWWNRIFEKAGLPSPRLEWEHTGWGLMSQDPKHRRSPAYYNYGFLVAPRMFIERMGETYQAEIDIVDRVIENNWAKSQIANTLAFSRHGIPCGTLSINYNFPLHVPGDQMRILNPDEHGEDSNECIKIFHYLGQGEVNREHFATREGVEEVLNRPEMSAAGRVFQRKLQIVDRRIASEPSARGGTLSNAAHAERD